MTFGVDLAEARSLGSDITDQGLARIRASTLARVRTSIGFNGEPFTPCFDPSEAFVGPDSVVRVIHRDLGSMLIGGLASLLLQTLHPLAMAGVADHSAYRDDPLGRLERTARFVGITTFGTTEEAQRAIDKVKSIHTHVTGVTPDGEPYCASDPDLLTWVHVAEVQSFLAAADAYGPVRLSQSQRDAYVFEMARVAHELGAITVPRTQSDVTAYLEMMRPSLMLTPAAKDARNFIMRGVRRWPHEMATYGLLVAAAHGTLPTWARRMLKLPTVPLSDALAVRPAARLLCESLRWVTSAGQVESVNPPSTTTT